MPYRDCTESLSASIAKALDAAGASGPVFAVSNHGTLASCFDVAGLATATVGAACAELSALADPAAPAPRVDTALAARWFGVSIHPTGWELPPVWDDVAGVYRSADGYIRLHTNAAHHKAAALTVLDCEASAAAVRDAVGTWKGGALESAIVAAGGCAAELRTHEAWQAHPQGSAVAAEPLVAWETCGAASAQLAVDPGRPLSGLRVLDLTRVLAGPVATRFLAAFGAEVLRIDPPGWREDNVVPDVTLGKRCATLQLHNDDDRARLLALLADADVLVHGYRADALERLGLGEKERHAANPTLIDVALCAYGWSGPWRNRRGYDSLVQMSCGIAAAGGHHSGEDGPVPLPVQALDHATGYLMAAAVLRALRVRRERGVALRGRLSLARTAALLQITEQQAMQTERMPAKDGQLADDVESTPWGPARRLRFPAQFAQLTPRWDRPACELHSDVPRWQH